jgi:hypothetical protein
MGQLIAGFLLNFPNETLERRFLRLALCIGGNHPGHGLDKPASPAAFIMRGKPELIDGYDNPTFRIVKQSRNRVPALED